MRTFLTLVAFIVVQFLACAIVMLAQTTGAVSGRLVDDKAMPVVGATITVDDTHPRRGAVSRAPDGAFTITGLTPGDYSFRIRIIGYNVRTFVARIAAGEMTRVGPVSMTSRPSETGRPPLRIPLSVRRSQGVQPMRVLTYDHVTGHIAERHEMR